MNGELLLYVTQFCVEKFILYVDKVDKSMCLNEILLSLGEATVLYEPSVLWGKGERKIRH